MLFMMLFMMLFIVRLNGARVVTGVLRGFDPFMNLVVDDAIEETKTGEKINIGMVVSRNTIISPAPLFE